MTVSVMMAVAAVVICSVREGVVVVQRQVEWNADLLQHQRHNGQDAEQRRGSGACGCCSFGSHWRQSLSEVYARLGLPVGACRYEVEFVGKYTCRHVRDEFYAPTGEPGGFEPPAGCPTLAFKKQ